MMNMRLRGSRVVIVGGSSGIGFSLAAGAKAHGARVLIAGRSMERLNNAAGRLDGGIETGVLDATDEAKVSPFFAYCGELDHLAVLVPSAPSRELSAKLGPFLETDSSVFEAVMRNKFWSAYYCVRHAAPHLTPGGSITFVTATTPRKPIPGYSATAAANGAAEALANTLALELAPVRVNVVAPGFVETELIATLPSERRAAWDRVTARQPVARMARPEEIADAILFVMANGYMTGEIITVDGGYKYT